ncbi:hypothetical protein OIU85_025222, partial [Salix viminalis]
KTGDRFLVDRTSDLIKAGSGHLDVAPSKANQSLDDISELKHRSMLITKNIDLLFETFFK